MSLEMLFGFKCCLNNHSCWNSINISLKHCSFRSMKFHNTYFPLKQVNGCKWIDDSENLFSFVFVNSAECNLDDQQFNLDNPCMHRIIIAIQSLDFYRNNLFAIDKIGDDLLWRKNCFEWTCSLFCLTNTNLDDLCMINLSLKWIYSHFVE